MSARGSAASLRVFVATVGGVDPLEAARLRALLGAESTIIAPALAPSGEVLALDQAAADGAVVIVAVGHCRNASEGRAASTRDAEEATSLALLAIEAARMRALRIAGVWGADASSAQGIAERGGVRILNAQNVGEAIRWAATWP